MGRVHRGVDATSSRSASALSPFTSAIHCPIVAGSAPPSSAARYRPNEWVWSVVFDREHLVGGHVHVHGRDDTPSGLTRVAVVALHGPLAMKG